MELIINKEPLKFRIYRGIMWILIIYYTLSMVTYECCIKLQKSLLIIEFVRVFLFFLKYYKKSFTKAFKNLERCSIIIDVGHNEIIWDT